MAVRAFTDDPEGLLSAIRRRLDEGAVRTWKIDEDGDLTLARENYSGEAWMRPRILRNPNRLVFNIIGKKGRGMSTRVYAIYHSELVRMLLTYFDTRLKTASATSLPSSGDEIAE